MLSSFLPHYTRKQWWAFATLLLATFAGTVLSFQLYNAPALLSTVMGVSLAMLVLEGDILWPAVSLGYMLASFINGFPLPTIAIFTVAYTIAPVFGAFLLRKLRFNPLFRRLRDAGAFFIAAVLSSALVPSIGFGGVYVSERFYGLPFPSELTWTSWFVGILLSIFLISPLILRWGIRPYFHRTRQEILELIGAFALFFAVAIPLTWTPYDSILGISLVYAVLAPMFWVALRSGPRFLSVMLLAYGILTVTGVMFGIHDPSVGGIPTGTLLFDNQILICIFALIFYTVTSIEEERKEALEQVSNQIAKLENILSDIEDESRAKTDFLAVLAHELRNPLAPVMSSIELLRVREWIKPEGAPVIDVMEGSLHVVRRLLDDILDISKITQNKLVLQKEIFHLGSAARRAVQVVSPRFEEKGQDVVMALPLLPLMLEADPVRIEQIITNLLINASKFTPSGRKVKLTVREAGAEAEIRVQDEGIGIERGMLDRIFEPFVQIEQGHQGREGLGIGLALTKRLVEAHGGRIEARSLGKNHGSQFIVRLPVSVSAHALQKQAKRETQAKQSQQAMRILVVDDNTAAARAIGALLQHDGHTVDYATSGKETRKKAAEFHPDAAILDIGLPDINGYDLATKLRKENEYRGLLIALTGYGQEEDKEKALRSGFDIHLTKPVAMKDLRTALSGA